MKIYISSDHAGFELKQHLVSYLEGNGFDVSDLGPKEYDQADDYPTLIVPVADAIARSASGVGIVIGLSGQGEALVANKVKGVRAGVYYGGPIEIIELLRQHNNANVLSLGSKFLTKKDAELAVDTFIQTQFSEEDRHIRRIEEIKKIEFKQ